jgi:ADP-ribose pyrophosphatase YjhB (NUDIX family)
MNVRCLVWFKGKLLLVKKSYGSKHWTVPGGAVENNETAEQATKREVKEETGFELSALTPTGSYETKFKNEDIIVSCFSSEVSSENFKVDGEEIEKAGWFSPDDLPTPLSGTVRQVLKRYKIRLAAI